MTGSLSLEEALSEVGGGRTADQARRQGSGAGGQRARLRRLQQLLLLVVLGGYQGGLHGRRTEVGLRPDGAGRSTGAAGRRQDDRSTRETGRANGGRRRRREAHRRQQSPIGLCNSSRLPLPYHLLANWSSFRIYV